MMADGNDLSWSEAAIHSYCRERALHTFSPGKRRNSKLQHYLQSMVHPTGCKFVSRCPTVHVEHPLEPSHFQKVTVKCLSHRRPTCTKCWTRG